MSNQYCEKLGLDVPVLENLKGHQQANTYSLLIAALLERGGPMTLMEVANRFAAAGIAPVDSAFSSLQRCRPARAPVFRDEKNYALDLQDDELDFWAFRLGLRPPKVEPAKTKKPVAEALPGPEVPLTVDELVEAWQDAAIYCWSALRVALSVLDAHKEPMTPADVLAFANAHTRGHLLSSESAQYWAKGAAIRVRVDGMWEMDAEHKALLSARTAVRKRLENIRRRKAERPDPKKIRANILAWERKREAHAAELAELRRVILHGFPAKGPIAVVLLDVGAHEISMYLGPELDEARARLADYDVIGALQPRALLKALDFDLGERQVADLGPPQKSKQLNKRGRKLMITTAMLIQGSCGISRPLGEQKKLREYLRQGQSARLRRRLEADAKSLFAIYQYGRLHGAVRLRWGFLDEMIRAPWVHRDEVTLYGLLRRASERGQAIEAIIGSAPGWTEPWARAQLCQIGKDTSGNWLYLIDEEGHPIDERDVQLARLVQIDA
jgi:hypothetical protein